MRKLIKNGQIYDGKSDSLKNLDVLINGKYIEDIGKFDFSEEGIEIIDANNQIVSPGFIDIHSHLREPGYEYKETISTGTMAAAKGGFTTLCAMPTTIPALDSHDSIEYLKDLCEIKAKVKVLPIASVTEGRKGKKIVEMQILADSGAIGFSDDGEPVSNNNIMKTALEYSRMVSRPIMNHCDDREINLEGRGVMNEGYLAQRLGCHGIPNAAEASMLSRDILLTELTNGNYHACHISASQSLDVLSMAKKRGIPFTAEVTPHHLTLTEKYILGSSDKDQGKIGDNAYNTNAKVFPPLRKEADIESMIKGVNNDLITIIATDHAPHGFEDKMTTLNQAAFGISNFETSLGSVLETVHTNQIKLTKLLKCMTSNPAAFLNLKIGQIKKNYPADITIFDLNKNWIVDTNNFVSKGKNTPIIGKELKGKVTITMVDGVIIYSCNGE